MIYRECRDDDGFLGWERIPEYGDYPSDDSGWDDGPDESDDECRSLHDCYDGCWAIRMTHEEFTFGGELVERKRIGWLGCDGRLAELETEGSPILLFPYDLKWLAQLLVDKMVFEKAEIVKVDIEPTILNASVFPPEEDFVWVRVLNPELKKSARKFFVWSPLGCDGAYFEWDFDWDTDENVKRCLLESDGAYFELDMYENVKRWLFRLEMAWLVQILINAYGGVLKVSELEMPGWYPKGIL